ncbi:MAG: ATP-binding protein [Thermodesulfobacteriota bacterium]
MRRQKAELINLGQELLAKRPESGPAELARDPLFLRRDENRPQAGGLMVVTVGGEILADAGSRHKGGRIDPGNPELAAAAGGGIGTAIRYDPALHQDILLVAMPVARPAGTAPEGFLVLYTPTLQVGLVELAPKGKLLLVLLAALLVTTLFSYLLALRINTPLQELRSGIEHFTRTKFKMARRFRNSRHSYVEIEKLSKAVEQLTESLSVRIVAAEQQRSELEAVFSSMVEAVIVVDPEGRIKTVNKAAATLLKTGEGRAQGRTFLEIINNISLHQFVKQSLKSRRPIEAEIQIVSLEEGNVFLQAHGVHLAGQDQEEGSGALIVLNDVTRLRRLENIRKDFVANVSHELKTPITTIKGFVETLRDGAIDNPDDARHFLDIVLKHADRLNAIVEDLLTLSRIEQEDENAEIVLESELLIKPLKTAIETCSVKAADKNIRIALRCPEDLRAAINAPLLDQAITNLIVNAIKYSDDESEVLVSAAADGEQAVIQVRDSGTGIAREHLPRLFERFYRSDKARSRKLGGTGLGLAIVKHIVQAHKGQVGVESVLGEGTTFTISLPLNTLRPSAAHDPLP